MAYGLKVYATAGSPIFDTTTLPLNLITCKDAAGVEIVTQTIANGVTGSPVFVDGLSPTNGAIVFVAITAPQALNAATSPWTFNRGNGSFTITNNMGGSATFNFLAGRYK